MYLCTADNTGGAKNVTYKPETKVTPATATTYTVVLGVTNPATAASYDLDVEIYIDSDLE